MADIIRTAKAEAVAGLQIRAQSMINNVMKYDPTYRGLTEMVKSLEKDLKHIDDQVMKICEMELQAELGYQQLSGSSAPEVKVEK